MTALSPSPVTGSSHRSTTRWRRLIAPAATIGGLSLATLALHLRDPHQSGSWGMCPLYAATGIYCPGCGGLRAVNDLTDGHLGAALSSNLLLTVLMPFVVVLLGVWVHDRWTGRVRQVQWSRQQGWLLGLLVVFAVFTVVRNVGFGAWLAP